MRTVDVVATAFANTFRSKLRTTLTVLAIVIGAFTLSLTSGVGTGITTYIDDTVASVGSSDVMTVTRTVDTPLTSGPQEYDPDRVSAGFGAGGSGGAPQGAPGGGLTVEAITSASLDELAGVEGVVRVEPARSVSVDYVQHDDGTRYQISLGTFIPGMQLTLEAGANPDDGADELQVALPVDYVGPLGLPGADDAVGATVHLAVTDATGTQHTVDATVVGVIADGLIAAAGGVPNDALLAALADAQNTGLAADKTDQYTSAYAWYDDTAGDAATDALKGRLADLGYTATTLQDQLGQVTSVIDTIVLVLNGFAVIALLAAGIGIVNTLLMSVQERTREIGLMKAVGMGSGRVFALFSLEAVTIGFLGSAIGVLAAVGAGRLVDVALSGSILSELPGLTLVSFRPASVATVVLGVMALAFVAGTLPAARAARQDPIESLRYE